MTVSSAGRWCCPSSSRSERPIGAGRRDDEAGAARLRAVAPTGARASHALDRCPPWDSATARTIARPRPKEPPRSPAPRTKRSNSVGASSGGTPGPSSSTTSRAWPSRGRSRCDTRISVPGGVWRRAFSIRLIVEPVQLVARALDERRLDVERRSRAPALTGPSSAAASTTIWARSHGSRAHDAPDVGARQQQQVGDEPAHALGGAQRRARRVALVAVQRVGEQLEVGEHARQRRAQLVRGVGDELALARERRLGLAARGVELAEHALERARELGDLVVGLGLGHAAARGRACARSRAAVEVSSRDRRHRAARDRHPGEQRERRSRRARRAAGTARRARPSPRSRRAGGRTGRTTLPIGSPSAEPHDRAVRLTTR